MSLLTGHDGSASGSDTLGHWFAEAIEEAGLHEDSIMPGFHGAAALSLAEAGCGAH